MRNNILEISKRANRAGRVPIKIALLKIHENPDETNINGLHWDEQYVLNAIDSVKMMPICAEFCTEDKSVPLGHGLTGSEKNDNGFDEPVFENSEAVGVIESGSIEDVEINGENIKALCGTGYLYNQRYPKFVKWVRSNYAVGNVDTSIEIVGLETNANKIVYLEDEPSTDFRTPCEFAFSGTAILSVPPSDLNAIVIEIAQKKEQEEEQMDEKIIRDVIVNAVNETNSKNEELTAQIAELNSTIEAKDVEINELNATVEQVQKALDDLKKEYDTYWEERAALEKELGELKAKQRIDELNSAIKDFSEAEKKYAEAEINSFNEKPLEGDVGVILGKIYAGIGQAAKEEAKTAELNSKQSEPEIDIFSEVSSAKDSEVEDINIF